MEPNILEQVTAQFAEARRHFDVVAERLESNQRLMAEGLSGLDAKLDRVENGLRRELVVGFGAPGATRR